MSEKKLSVIPSLEGGTVTPKPEPQPLPPVANPTDHDTRAVSTYDLLGTDRDLQQHWAGCLTAIGAALQGIGLAAVGKAEQRNDKALDPGALKMAHHVFTYQMEVMNPDHPSVPRFKKILARIDAQLAKWGVTP